eukprot:m.246086 g.246086  ORF g.246086 m.246086 type:complete len:234 (+) comp57633_c0_seq1:1-702(+)
MLAMGVLLAVIERQTSGEGQVIDVAMTEGANYVALPLFKWLQPGGFLQTAQDGSFDPTTSVLHQGAPWSETYQCSDGKWFAVQAIEPHFYRQLVACLGIDESTLPPRADSESWPGVKSQFQSVFLTKTRDEWESIFQGTDACGAPVLTATEAARHPHNVARGSFAPTPEHPGHFEPVPAPRLSRTPGYAPRPRPKIGADTSAVLRESGFSRRDVDKLLAAGLAVDTSSPTSKL